MTKPVYEIPVSGNEGSSFAPPSAPILEPQRSDYPPPGSFEPSSAGFGAPAPGSAVPPPGSAVPPPGSAAPAPGFAAPGFAPPPTGSAAAPFPAPPSYASPGAGFPEPAAFPPPAGYSAPTQERAPQQEFFFSSGSTAQGTKADRPFSGNLPGNPFTGSSTVTERFVEPGNQSPIALVDPQLIAVLQEVLMAIASDLHISADAVPMIRVDGSLKPIPSGTVWGKEKVRNALLSMLTPVQRAEFEQKLELDFAYTLSANARFRVNFYQDRGALGAAFRLIPTQILALDKLGVPEVVARFATLARGLVLVTGPTGSGKSTTIAALIDMVNRTRADHIVTVEDPIEFLHTNQRSLVNQREVGADTHSFAAALKHVLRQDPDVILIGELRDLETISAALTAAETGHLVFASLHTQDAPQTIDRIIDVFPAHQQAQIRSQVAATLQGVVCQTLVKRANGKGRAVATEVLVTTPAVANLIREGKTFQIASSMQAGRDLGMHTLDQHLAELVNEGTITQETALERVHDPEGFKRLVRREPTSAADGFSLADQQGLN